MSSESIIKKATSTPENSTNQELDELELDAIAGGIRTITASGPKPNFGPGPSINMNFIEAIQSYWGQQK
jgi:hypothetical protein